MVTKECIINIPDDCRRYPGHGDRRVHYQHMSFVKDGLCYVAVEAKIYKYAHYLHFARFKIEGDVAYMDALESVSIDYEMDYDEVELTDPLIRCEIMTLLPSGCHEIKIAKHLAHRVGPGETFEMFNKKEEEVKSSQVAMKMFDLSFSGPASKKTTIQLIAKPDGTGGCSANMEHFEFQ